MKDQNTTPLSPTRKPEWEGSSETFLMPSPSKGLHSSPLLITILPPAMAFYEKNNPPPSESEEEGSGPSPATNKEAGNLTIHPWNEGSRRIVF